MDVRRSVISLQASFRQSELRLVPSKVEDMSRMRRCRLTNKGDAKIGAAVLAHIRIPMAAIAEGGLSGHSRGLEDRQIRKSQIE